MRDYHKFGRICWVGRRDGGTPGEQVGQCFGGGTGVEQDAAGLCLRDQGEGRLRDAHLLVRALDGPFVDAFFGGAEAVGGHGPAVDAAHGAGGFECGEVAADGFGGDAEALRQHGHADPAGAGYKLGDLLLALLGEHVPSIA